MKGLSLWQPWASLVVEGHKRIETRHWHPPQKLIGKRIAIHAAKLDRHDRLVLTPPFDVLDPELAHGAVLGTVILKSCVKTTDLDLARLHPNELAFGNYAPLRFAWLLSEPRCFAEPFAYRGKQGFFEVANDLVKGRTIRPCSAASPTTR